MPCSRRRRRRARRSPRSCRARGGPRRGRRRRRRSPTGARVAGRRGQRVVAALAVGLRRSGGSAAGRATSKPSSASRGSCCSTPSKPPHERGNSSYQAPNAGARRGRPRCATAARSVGAPSARLAALDGREQLGAERRVVLGVLGDGRRPRACAAACSISAAVVAARRALGAPRAAAARPRPARRRARAGRPATLRSSSSRQVAERVGPGLDRVLPAAERGRPSNAPRPADAAEVRRRSGRSSASLQSAARRAAVADDRAQDVVAVAEDVGRDRRPVADAALGRIAAAVDRGLGVLDHDPRRPLAGGGAATASVACGLRWRGRSRAPKVSASRRRVNTVAVNDLSARSQRRPAAPDLAARRAGSGREAYRFVDWLAAAGQTWWQVLPLGPPDRFGSPVQVALGVRGLAGAARRPARAGVARRAGRLPRAPARTGSTTGSGSPGGGARRRPGPLRARVGRAARLRGRARRAAARRRRRSTSRRAAPTTAPIPSCSSAASSPAPRRTRYSATGQLWGNPLYDWPALRRRRLPLVGRAAAARRWRCSTSRGSTTSAASSPTGRCPARRTDAPRRALAARARAARCSTRPRASSGELPLVAEDLGVITPAGRAAARRARAAGDGRAPVRLRSRRAATARTASSNHVENRLVYTGTHDHDTARGWYASLDARSRARWSTPRSPRAGSREREPWWALIRLAFSSPARVAMIQAQECSGSGSEARMNNPARPAATGAGGLEPRGADAGAGPRLREATEEAGRLRD